MSSALENAGARTLIDEMDGKPTPHSHDVLAWRESEFLDMGFASREAAAMSRMRVDLHHMRQLLDSGCPHEFASRILRGTCFEGDDDFDYTVAPVPVAVAAADDEDDGA